MKKWIKWTLTTVVLTLLIALGLYLAWTGTQREEQRVAPEDPPVPVTVRELKPGDFTLTALYNGKLEAVSDVSVITMVRGIVIDDRISEGQRVSKGQVLYRLDDDSYRFSMLQAEASVQLHGRSHQVPLAAEHHPAGGDPASRGLGRGGSSEPQQGPGRCPEVR